MTNSLSRRSFIKRTSQGVAAAVTSSVIGVSGSAQASGTTLAAENGEELNGKCTWINRALSPGMKVLGQWSVEKVSPLHFGAVVILLENRKTGEAMRVDVCKKAGLEATVGVESTPNHELIVMNGGNGKKWTQRRYHLVVRALARMMDSEDLKTAEKTTLMTHVSRVGAFGPSIVASNPFDLPENAHL